MAKGNPNPKNNLKNLAPPIRTPKEAAEKGRNGGIKSGEARRKKKLLSEMYADFLATHEQQLQSIFDKLIIRGDATTVSMLKEMGERTEGNKIKTEGSLTINIDKQDSRL